MKRQKRSLFISIIIIMVLIAAGCSGISGTYVSECGRFAVEFERSGDATWFQDGMFFQGTYESTSNGFRLLIYGDGMFHLNTSFDAVRDERDLIITGGIVNGERFIRS